MYRLLLRFLLLSMFLSVVSTLSARNTSVFPVTSQRFENGEMIYNRDTGAIYVLSSHSGQWWFYETSAYSQLPDNLHIDAPHERYAPINGFGRIWANNDLIREELGWAVLPEIGFDMSVEIAEHGNVYFTRLNGIILHLRPSGNWRVLSPKSETNTAQIQDFTVTPTSLESGMTMTIEWNASGSEYVTIEIRNLDNPRHNTDAFFQSSDLEGQVDWTIPETVVGQIEVVLNLVNRPPASGYSCCLEHVDSQAILVDVIQSSQFETETYAAFQQYENGFMIWREDSESVLTFFNNGTWQYTPKQVYENNTEIVGTDTCITPVNAFARVLAGAPDMYNELGCAVSAEVGFTLIIQGDATGDFTYTLPDTSIITLSDNRWE